MNQYQKLKAESAMLDRSKGRRLQFSSQQYTKLTNLSWDNELQTFLTVVIYVIFRVYVTNKITPTLCK